jgi:hypothetical protein
MRGNCREIGTSRPRNPIPLKPQNNFIIIAIGFLQLTLKRILLSGLYRWL